MTQFGIARDRIATLPLASYCLLAGVIALFGSAALIGIALFVSHAMGLTPAPDSSIDTPGLADAFGIIVFAPLVETLLLAGCLRLTSGLGHIRSCLVCALFWGVLHGLLSPVRFFGTIWSFFVFGFSYLLWRKRSVGHAFTAAAVPHVIVNSVAFVALAVAGSA